jgi:hypothetical protein
LFVDPRGPWGPRMRRQDLPALLHERCESHPLSLHAPLRHLPTSSRHVFRALLHTAHQALTD